MALNTFGWTPAEVTTDSAGNAIAGAELTVWADLERTTPIGFAYARDGVTVLPTKTVYAKGDPTTALTGAVVTSGAKGRFGFLADDTYSILYVWDGSTDDPWPVAAHEALDSLTVNGKRASRKDALVVDARDYGVKADGTTDDTAAWASAVSAAAALTAFGSTSVRAPAGTSVVTGIDLPSMVSLEGHPRRSRIKLANSANRPVIRTATLTTQAVSVRSVTIDGNKANQTGGVSHGIHLSNQSAAIAPAFEQYLQDSHHTVDDVLILNCDGHGILTDGRGETAINRVRSLFNTGDGFRINSFDTWVGDCSAGMNTGQGFNILMPNVSLADCKAFINANGFRFAARATTGSNLVAQGNNGDGALFVAAKDCHIGIVAFDSNYAQSATPLTGVGARFTSASDRNRVTLMAHNQEVPNRQQAAYYIPSGTGNVIDVTTDGTMPLRPNSSFDRGNVIRMRSTGGFAVDAYAATITPDLTSGTTRQVTLTGNLTVGRPLINGVSTVEYFPEGIQLTFVFTQDATGGRTVSWGAGFIDKGWQPNPTGSTTSVVTWALWGGNWQIVGGHYPGAALTAADASTVGATYTATEQGVVNNVRTRLNQLETRLKAQGLLL